MASNYVVTIYMSAIASVVNIVVDVPSMLFIY
jgi:hypothetical protein